MSAQTEICALIFGLDRQCSDKYWGDNPNADVGKIFEGLEASEKTLLKIPGVHARFFYADIDSETSIVELKSVIKQGDLQHGGRPWDMICIGWGVRGHLGLTTHFESLVNYAKDTVPSAKITFTAKPTGHLETITRWFPQLGQQE